MPLERWLTRRGSCCWGVVVLLLLLCLLWLGMGLRLLRIRLVVRLVAHPRRLCLGVHLLMGLVAVLRLGGIYLRLLHPWHGGVQ